MGLFDDVLDNVGEPYKGGKGFEYGTHEVIILQATAKQKNTKKADDCDIIEVIVGGKEDNTREATCTLWFHTEGAAKMSITKVLGMLVHKVDDDKKEKVRELGKRLFGDITDISKARDVATKLMQEKLIGAEAYLVAEPSGKYTTTSYGDLWHYAAEPQSGERDEPNTVDKDDEITEADLPDFGAEGDDL